MIKIRVRVYLVTRFQILVTFLVDEVKNKGPEIARFLYIPQHGPVLLVLIMEQCTEMVKRLSLASILVYLLSYVESLKL